MQTFNLGERVLTRLDFVRVSRLVHNNMDDATTALSYSEGAKNSIPTGSSGKLHPITACALCE